MSIDLRQLPTHVGALADYKTWGQGIGAQIAAVGLVKTADTGQIDWAALATPPIANAYVGYEIYRFNDSFQATKPVFIKIEYGAGANAFYPALRIQIATATNGAGVLGGQIGILRPTPSGAAKAAGLTHPSYCSGNASRLNLCTNVDPSSSNYTMLFFVERTKNSVGVDTGDGIVAHSQHPSSGLFQVIPFVGTVPQSVTVNNALCTLIANTGGLSTVGVDVVLSPTLAFLGKCLFASWCAYTHADIGELAPFAMNHLGADHTYLPLGDTLSGYYTNQAAQTGMSLAMLWE